MHDLAHRWIHYAWRHWKQIKHVPGISWHRIAASYTMLHIDQELTCKVLLRPPAACPRMSIVTSHLLCQEVPKVCSHSGPF